MLVADPASWVPVVEMESFARGAFTPMPTLTLAVAPLTLLTEPSTMQSLQATSALAPKAVAFVNPPVATSELKPRLVLSVPLSLLDNAQYPSAVFFLLLYW